MKPARADQRRPRRLLEGRAQGRRRRRRASTWARSGPAKTTWSFTRQAMPARSAWSSPGCFRLIGDAPRRSRPDSRSGASAWPRSGPAGCCRAPDIEDGRSHGRLLGLLMASSSLVDVEPPARRIRGRRSRADDAADAMGPRAGLVGGRTVDVLSTASGAADQNHADAAVEGAQHLGFGASYPRLPASQRKTGGTFQANSPASLGRQAVGQHPRQVLGEAAAGDMGERPTRPPARSPPAPGVT